MKKVIVFGPGMVNTLGMIRSLGQKGLEVHVIMESSSKGINYVAKSRYIKRIHNVHKNEEVINILKKEYYNENQRIAVLCGGDDAISLLDKHYDELKDRFLVFNCGRQGGIVEYLDKEKQFEVASQAGLSIIKSYRVNSVSSIPLNIIYPCLTKGNNSTSSTKSDMHICQSFQELKECINEGTDYLIQEYIKKEFELNFVCISFNHGQDVYVPCVIRKIRDEIGRQSAYFITDNISNYHDFDIEILNRIASQLNYEGIFSVEVIYCQGKYYFLEINLRNDGCGYLYTASGCNYPYLWHRYAVGELSPQDMDFSKVRIPCTMMGEQDIKNLFERKVCLATWLRQFAKADVFYILSINDPLPFLYSSLSHCIQLCKRIKKKTIR